MYRAMLVFVTLGCSGCLFGHDDADNENFVDESHLQVYEGNGQSARAPSCPNWSR
jgi:hypothetical protein